MRAITVNIPNEFAIFANLNIIQRGIFTSLREAYFLTENPLTPQVIKSWCPVSSPEEERALQEILEVYYCKRGDKWVNTDYEKLLQDFRQGKAKNLSPKEPPETEVPEV